MKEKRTNKELHIAARNLQIYYGCIKRCIGYREAVNRLKLHCIGKRRDNIASAMEPFLFTEFENVDYSRGY